MPTGIPGRRQAGHALLATGTDQGEAPDGRAMRLTGQEAAGGSRGRGVLTKGDREEAPRGEWR